MLGSPHNTQGTNTSHSLAQVWSFMHWGSWHMQCIQTPSCMQQMASYYTTLLKGSCHEPHLLGTNCGCLPHSSPLQPKTLIQVLGHRSCSLPSPQWCNWLSWPLHFVVVSVGLKFGVQYLRPSNKLQICWMCIPLHCHS